MLIAKMQSVPSLRSILNNLTVLFAPNICFTVEPGTVTREPNIELIKLLTTCPDESSSPISVRSIKPSAI